MKRSSGGIPKPPEIMNWQVILLQTLLVANSALSQNRYGVASIPTELRTGVDAVVRIDQRVLRIESKAKAREQIKMVVTILNQDGREFGQQIIWYDSFLKVGELRGALYDEHGEELRPLGKTDINDHSAFSDYSLFEDNRVRVVGLFHNRYPYTVAIEYELEYDGFISWPSWRPQRLNASVESGLYQVTVPRNLGLRYWSKDTLARLEIAEGDEMQYTWRVTALPPFEAEPVGPPIAEQASFVVTAPTVFQMGSFPGDMSSWKSFGLWFYNLNMGRDKLPLLEREKVRSLVSELENPREKVRRLYEYMQSKTRYVNVTLGIGGWQPFEASYVSENGYGDCKALTNYMMSLVRYAGIPAFPVLVRNGYRVRDIRTEFPNNEFNHVILCVPLPTDSIWLECTSQSIAFGHIGSSNENRHGLAVTPNGGVLVRTPKSSASQNLQCRTASVTIDESGDGLARVRTIYTGDPCDQIGGSLFDKSAEERERWLVQNIEVPTFHVISTDFSGIKRGSPSLAIEYGLELPKYASMSGSRLFFQPNLMERQKTVPREVRERRQPVRFSSEYTNIDSISFNVPDNFRIEGLPESVSVQTSFCRYLANVSSTGNRVNYVRIFEITQTNLPPEQYKEFRAFLKKVVTLDKTQVVLVRTI